MRSTHLGFAVALGVGMALPLACGNKDDGGGEEAETGGVLFAGGTANFGGTSGTRTGGTSGSSGSGGTTNQDCPSDAPSDGESCQGMEDAFCLYGTSFCLCFAGFGDPTWNCPTCPDAEPQTGDSCNSNGLDCDYDGTTCVCEGFGNGEWNCDGSTPTCPTNAPQDGAACDSEGLSCPYLDGTCVCEGGGGPGGMEWNCQAAEPTCPDTAPDPGDNCDGDGLSCPFGDTTCECQGGEWQCDGGTPVCPEQQPDLGDDCTGSVDLSCIYGTQECICFPLDPAGDAGEWDCA